VHFTMTGGTGSYLYMAGEVCRHEPYNAKADVYSFAMILYEIVTGLWPFQGMDPIRAAMTAATDGLRPTFPLEPPAHFSTEEVALLPKVQALIMRCWDQHPIARCAFHNTVAREHLHATDGTVLAAGQFFCRRVDQPEMH
jgi:serine/threonine protein kinase